MQIVDCAEEMENSCTRGTGCGHGNDLVLTYSEERWDCESVECCSGQFRSNGRCY